MIVAVLFLAGIAVTGAVISLGAARMAHVNAQRIAKMLSAIALLESERMIRENDAPSPHMKVHPN